MSCILRIGGKSLDIDALLEQIGLEADSFWRKGEHKYPGSEKVTRVNESSGARFIVSASEMSDIQGQMDQAANFFRERREEIRRMVAFPGVEWAVADFGAEISPPGWCSFTFPAALTELIGSAGVSLELSVYPVDDSEDSEKLALLPNPSFNGRRG